MEKKDLEMYLEKGMSYTEISKETGIPKPTIAWNVKKFNLIAAKKFVPPEKEVLYDLYINQKLSMSTITKKLGVWEKSVFFWLNKYEIPIRKIGTNQFTFVEKKIKIKKTKVSKRESEETIKKFVEEKNCTYIQSYTKNGKLRIKYICHCGHNHDMQMCNFKSGNKCKECKRKKLQGKNNHNFNASLTEEDRLELGRYEEGYKSWRRAVYRKYNYKCDNCDISGNGENLTAHHLNGYSQNLELRTCIENGVCLCIECHKKFHSIFGYGKNTKDQYIEFKCKAVLQVR